MVSSGFLENPEEIRIRQTFSNLFYKEVVREEIK
jgi:hypothetical protein